MSDIAIKAEGLGKKYLIRHQQQGRRYKALRDVLSTKAKSILRFGQGTSAKQPDASREEFWALKDISFEIAQGEAVGIIGSNGAGKSTLLKLLSRITEPSKGRIELNGRLASLLEVGTGFHPELTGRENIYLNGAILGMSRVDIKRDFDAIVAFAQVERFLDTPVKRYSSGMYMRLAFAVAAHLEPEILVIDEVLAVGDMEFQKKCLGKMQDVSKSGRTVVFVSHNMDAILRMCPRSLVLKNGSLEAHCSSKEAVELYLSQKIEQHTTIDLGGFQRPLDLRFNARLTSVEMVSPGKADGWNISYGEVLEFEVRFKVCAPLSGLELATCLLTATGTEITTNLSTHALSIKEVAPGDFLFKVTYPDLRLVPGRYYLRLGLASEAGGEDFIPKTCEFEVMVSDLSSKHQTDRFEGFSVPIVHYSFTK